MLWRCCFLSGVVMNKKIQISLYTIFGICLLGSYLYFSEAWATLDNSVFYFFNRRLVPGSYFLTITAWTNLRAFDVISFAVMGCLYFYYFQQQDNAGKRKMLALGLCMLLMGIVIKQCGRLIPIAHPSPTLVLPDSNRLKHLVDIAGKDASKDSFPGDHGMMLMIFAGFMARYFGKKAFAVAALIVIVFSLPRIASGAHWFTDIYVGSLAISSVCLSWFLLTPASEFCAQALKRLIPSFLFPEQAPGATRQTQKRGH